MNGSDYEPNINSKLADLLRETGLNAEEERSGSRIDIKVTFETHIVAIECKTHGPGKKVKAVEAACSRLGENSAADVSVALVYPQDCTNRNISKETVLVFAPVYSELCAETIDADTYAGLSRRLDWRNRNVRGLAEIIRKLLYDVGEPENLSRKLRQILMVQARRLGNDQCTRLATKIGLAPMSKRLTHSAAEQALLVVASAAMFHARLDQCLPKEKPDIDARTGEQFAGEWPPNTLSMCMNQDAVVAALRESWSLMLARDRTPIFTQGLDILHAGTGPTFSSIIKNVVKWANESIEEMASLRPELLGQLAHEILPDSKAVSSFYTSVPAAILLASLAIRYKSDVPDDMCVMDPACGAGTLLWAAANRVQQVANIDADRLVENVLVGVDINPAILHIAATTLGLLSPTTKTEKMRMYKAEFGYVSNDSKTQTHNGNGGNVFDVAAGSLEMYKGGAGAGALSHLSPGTAAKRTDPDLEPKDLGHSADLLIMNGPITRHKLRHGQFGGTLKKLVKQREAKIFRNTKFKPNKTSSGAMFLVLAEYLTKPNGAMALILPASAARNPSSQELRKFLAERFHIDTIVASHDPEHIHFSKNVSISEMLVILRRGPVKDTKIINLAVNPNTAASALSLADDILNGTSQDNMTILPWSKSAIMSGDWSGIQFFSMPLTEWFLKIRSGKMFPVAQLGKVARVGPNGRLTSYYFNKSSVPTTYPSLYGHETKAITSIQAQPDQYITPRPERREAAKQFWSKRATLLLPERIQPHKTRVAAVNSTLKTVGSAWTPVRPFSKTAKDSDKWSKTMTVYLNSTLGITSMLGVKIPFKLLYPKYSLNGCQKAIPVPVLSNDQIDQLAETYDSYATHKMGQWRHYGDSARKALDESVCDLLDVDADDINTMRHELSREPMVTGRRYAK